MFSLFSSSPPSNTSIVAFTGIGPGDSLLDVGCGPGAALENALAAGATVSGVDPSPSMVRRARARVLAADVKEGSAESLPFDEGSFTHVWSIAAFHHWAHPDGGIDEARRVLTRNGRLFIVERKLKSGKVGHGLSPGDAGAVSQNLAERGLVNCQVETMRAGKSDYLVISGSKP